jgi:hypothetical protein
MQALLFYPLALAVSLLQTDCEQNLSAKGLNA